ncbi:M48 family metallopeptidase [Uliginosibacterium sp. 31-12]|uniref:M48 family metallopeptidase n=1 Tax=Uliginosibacterium sp. 31-12 TaxID=3062781 RepID=UPI0026E3F64E|nr:M48 family metallopeptidase [Uliginosibacterium sp. 31-12]MDO6386397.1 M48 family metallopeptidase [Uliginosibacterium sp. 31-12]
MRYRNAATRRPDPQDAARGEHGELLRLLLSVSLILVACLFAADRLAVWLAPHLPFAAEVQLAESLKLDRLAPTLGGGAPGPQDAAIQQALQQHAGRITASLQLPSQMPIQLHYVAGDTVNAFATLGGHVFVFRGLLEKLRYEEELDAVLAHEIGHVANRHMVRQLSRGVMTASVLGLIGVRSPALNQWLIGDVQQLQMLAYSREAEREADATAQLASQRLHGGNQGLVKLFETFTALQAERGVRAPAWLQSHPLPAERAEHARAAGQDAARLTPLSGALALGRAEP